MSPPLHDSIVLVDDTTPRSGAMNMALDELLLGGLAETPILRCYRWQEREITFGCFGHFARVESEYPGLPKVRRWTGGGNVEHGSDFTYTVLVPKSLPLACSPTAVSYQSIHAALAAALEAVGINDLTSATQNVHPPATPENAPFLKACFANPVEHDLLAKGEKIAGGAQRRTRHGLMHQGSVQGHGGGADFTDSLRAQLAKSFAGVLAREIMERPISDVELVQAQRLSGQKYGTVAWTERF